MLYQPLQIGILTVAWCALAVEQPARKQPVQEVPSTEISKLKSWCDFRNLEGVRQGEPVLLKGAVTSLSEQWSFESFTSLTGDDLVAMEFTHGSDIRPYQHNGQGTLSLKWDMAKKLLRGEHPASSEYTFYIAQQPLISSTDLFLSELASSLPHSLRHMSPSVLLFWLSGKHNHTSSLHFDGMDNAFVLLQGRKQVLLYAPWEGANLACGRRLHENSFKWDDESNSYPTVGNVDFPSQPRWLNSCKSYQQHTTQWSADVDHGDILWIPAGWFHTVLSSPGTVGVSILEKEKPGTANARLVLQLLAAGHVRGRHPESDNDGKLYEELVAAYPDLENDGEVEVDENAAKLVSGFQGMLQQARDKHGGGREDVDSIDQAVSAMMQMPALSYLAQALDSSQKSGTKSEPEPRPVAKAVATLIQKSKARTLLEWWQEVFPGCLEGSGSGSCRERMREVAVVCAQSCPQNLTVGQGRQGEVEEEEPSAEQLEGESEL